MDELVIDILTKPFPKGKFLVFIEKLGLMDVILHRKGHD